MMTKAILNAEFHGMDVKPGVPNEAMGDCIFESVIESINNRGCFKDSLDGSPEVWRYLWMT